MTTSYKPSDLAISLANEAIDEDERCGGGRFDRAGWSEFFIEDWQTNPDAVDDAWIIYCTIKNIAK